jgi:hypothetical protein
MRARGIKPDFFTDEGIVDLTPWARLLFIGLWCVADRAGRMVDKPKQLKIKLFPCDPVDINGLLEELCEYGFIIRYEAGGARYIEVKNFAKHQSPHVKEAASTIPAPCKSGACTRRAALTVDTDTDTDTDTSADADRQVFDHWRTAMHHNGATVFDNKRRKAVKWALKNYGIDNCIAAIDGYAASDFHMGRDPKSGGKKYDDLTLIFRDAEHAEKFMDAPKTGCEAVDEYWGGNED